MASTATGMDVSKYDVGIILAVVATSPGDTLYTEMASEVVLVSVGDVEMDVFST